MVIAQIHLTEAESEALQTLAQRTGKTRDQLLHEAVERLLDQVVSKNRLDLLRQAKGLWKNRQDLPELRQLRAELDRL